VYLSSQARHYGLDDLARIWAGASGIYNVWGRRYDAANPKHIKSWSTQAFRSIKANKGDPRVRSWEGKKTQVMHRIVTAKFRGNQDARRALLATGSQFLIEASRSDTYWGAGTDGSDRHLEQALENGRLPGKNRLGMILMAVRDTCLRNNQPMRWPKKRTIRYHARRAARQDPQIPRDKESQWAKVATHFSWYLVPSIRPLVYKTNTTRHLLPTNGAILPANVPRRAAVVERRTPARKRTRYEEIMEYARQDRIRHERRKELEALEA
jgi:ribA/ribD-fused uncharacterized protein